MNSNIQKWLDALRSEDRSQTRGCLHRTVSGGSPRHPVGYCCLGIAVEVFDQENPGVLKRELLSDGKEGFSGEPYSLPDVVIAWLKIDSRLLGKVVTMNDSEGSNFFEIADYLERECADHTPDSTEEWFNPLTQTTEISSSLPSPEREKTT